MAGPSRQVPSTEDLYAGVNKTLVFENDDEVPLLDREVSFWDDGTPITPILSHQKNVQSIGTGVQTDQSPTQVKKTSFQDKILTQVKEVEPKTDTSQSERDSNEVIGGVKLVEGVGEASKEVTLSQMNLLCGKDGCECLIKHLRKPRILFMGQRQAGKTSIVECVFRKLPPEETLFVDPTVKMHKAFVTSFLSFIIYDAPGELNFLELSFDITGIFDNIDTIIWVFDAQTEWADALTRFHRTLMILKDRFPNMNIEVFIHKIEGMSDEYALEIKEDIIRRTEEELMDNGRSGMAIRYHLTSIYDRTVWEALSRVVQRVTPRLNAVEGLLDSLCESTGMVKIFLFDLYTKLYVATDTSPVDMQILDTCTHHVEFVSEMESVFGYKRKGYMEEQEDPEYKTPEVCSMVSLNDGKRLYMKEINQYLAIVGVTGRTSMKERNIVDFNISVFQEAVLKLVSEKWEEPVKPPE